MRFAAIIASLVLVACSSHDPEDARKCGVTEAQLVQAIEEVSEMNPYSGKPLGRCDLIVGDGDDVHVITPEIKRGVESMTARKEAETKN